MQQTAIQQHQSSCKSQAYNNMKTYQDKTTGKWKIGSNGKPIYDTEKEARRAGLDMLVERIWNLTRRKNDAMK